jgi:acyl carrier protein
MNRPTPDNVRVFVADFLNRKLRDRGQGPLNDLPDDYDVLLSGVLDSLAFVEMMMATGEHFVGEIDFENLDPEKMTIVGPLCLFVSEQLMQRQ